MPHSIRVVSDTLDFLNVDNYVYRITNKRINSVDGPLIVMLPGEDIPFHICYGVDSGGNIMLESSTGRKLSMTEQDFSKLWTGVCVLVNGRNTTKDSIFEYYIKQTLWYLNIYVEELLLCCYSFLFGVHYFLSDTKCSNYLFVTTLVGLFVSFLALRKPYYKSGIVQKFCRTNNKDGCDLIFRSKNAKLFEWISMAEISFAYFLSLSILMLCSVINVGDIVLMCCPILVAVVVYSLWVQVKTRILCKLCAIIDCILAAMIIHSIVLSGVAYFFALPLSTELIPFVLALIFSAFTAKTITRMIVLSEDVGKYVNRVERLLAEEEFLPLLLSKRDNCFGDADIGNFFPIEYLSPKSEISHHITVVVSPFCKWCSAIYEHLDRIQQCRISIIVNAPIDDSDTKTKAIQFIRSRFDVPDFVNVEQILMRHNAFCRKYSINYTPAIFIDGKLLPDIYEVSDLEFIL